VPALEEDLIVDDDLKRHIDIVGEGLRRDIAHVIEGLTANNERIDRLIVEMKQDFAEVRSMLRSSHAEFDRRLRVLEG
jgi:hypothetical protein